ncbi:hypothetical protein EYF80_067685 [Liparis tanakae]|uniref:Uncharacterized protein n=1 Tax=Liparis tanakae TaxID=230148 RepID=A0A4Z2E078_9TELE|nr:hypothetical protein EYF80_067685 [Liparis tanakae]
MKSFPTDTNRADLSARDAERPRARLSGDVALGIHHVGEREAEGSRHSLSSASTWVSPFPEISSHLDEVPHRDGIRPREWFTGMSSQRSSDVFEDRNGR